MGVEVAINSMFGFNPPRQPQPRIGLGRKPFDDADVLRLLELVHGVARVNLVSGVVVANLNRLVGQHLIAPWLLDAIDGIIARAIDQSAIDVEGIGKSCWECSGHKFI